MNAMAVMELVLKGLTVASAAFAAGRNVMPAITAVKNLATEATQNDGEVSDETLAATETQLDEMMAHFNKPLPKR